MMDLGLRGKRALVTGGNAGIGAATARRLAAEGVDVVIHGRNVGRAEDVAAEIRKAGGKAAVALGDLSNDSGAEEAAKAALAAFGGIDILVNSAGGPSNAGLNWSNIEGADWLRTFELNVVSTARMIRHCLPSMKAAGWGRIISIASMITIKPVPTIPDYSVSKAALPVMAMSLARELAGTGITVNAVSPGLVVTQVLKDYFHALPHNAGRRWEEIEGALAKDWNSCTGTIASTEDIANAIAFIVSPLAGHITGINLRIDGGMHGATN
jgi:3-oxoacyl-[acyl-carrier protein] reductase